MEHSITEEVVERVRQMEARFDHLQEALAKSPSAIRQDRYLQDQLRILMEYYEGGQWLRDYELDELGLLPEDLKRGVLAQDGLYDLFARIS